MADEDDGRRQGGSSSAEIGGGIVCMVVGLLMWRLTSGIQTPVIELDKAGLILALVGAGGLVYGLVLRMRR